MDNNIEKNENNNMPQKKVKNKKEHSALKTITKIAIAVVVVVFLFAFGFTYQVREGDCAIVMRFGTVRKEVTEAGLYFKLPWPFENVVNYDSRLQYLESNKLETTTYDKRNVILQSYTVWSINDPKLYHERVGVKNEADRFINGQIKSVTKTVLGQYKLTALVSLNSNELKLDEIQDEIFKKVRDACDDNYGIKVEDVSILRLSLPDTNLESVFEKMWAARKSEIDTIIANANKTANGIVSSGREESAEIEMEGKIEAAEIRARVEKEVAELYAAAQKDNMELYKFLTNLDSFVKSINSSSVLVVKADKYPFNVLLDYSKNLAPANGEVVIKDLNYILTNPDLSEADRNAFIQAVYDCINAAKAEQGGTTPGDGGTQPEGGK